MSLKFEIFLKRSTRLLYLSRYFCCLLALSFLNTLTTSSTSVFGLSTKAFFQPPSVASPDLKNGATKNDNQIHDDSTDSRHSEQSDSGSPFPVFREIGTASSSRQGSPEIPNSSSSQSPTHINKTPPKLEIDTKEASLSVNMEQLVSSTGGKSGKSSVGGHSEYISTAAPSSIASSMPTSPGYYNPGSPSPDTESISPTIPEENTDTAGSTVNKFFDPNLNLELLEPDYSNIITKGISAENYFSGNYEGAPEERDMENRVVADDYLQGPKIKDGGAKSVCYYCRKLVGAEIDQEPIRNGIEANVRLLKLKEIAEKYNADQWPFICKIVSFKESMNESRKFQRQYRRDPTTEEVPTIKSELDNLWMAQKHPNIAKIVDFMCGSDRDWCAGEKDDGGWYYGMGSIGLFIMPNYRGGDLFNAVQERSNLRETKSLGNGGSKSFLHKMFNLNKPPTDWSKIPISEDFDWKILKQAVDALVYLHDECNIVHRDIKPENMFLDRKLVDKDVEEGRVEVKCKIGDFGFAVDLNENSERLRKKCGSFPYVAPQILHGNYNRLCDVFAMGCSIYYTLSGFQPFRDFHSSNLEYSMDNVKKCIYSWPWICDDPSKDVWDLIQTSMEADDRMRITANQMKNHPWFIRQKQECEERRKQKELEVEREKETLKELELLEGEGDVDMSPGEIDADISPIEMMMVEGEDINMNPNTVQLEQDPGSKSSNKRLSRDNDNQVEFVNDLSKRLQEMNIGDSNGPQGRNLKLKNITIPPNKGGPRAELVENSSSCEITSPSEVHSSEVHSPDISSPCLPPKKNNLDLNVSTGSLYNSNGSYIGPGSSRHNHNLALNDVAHAVKISKGYGIRSDYSGESEGGSRSSKSYSGSGSDNGNGRSNEYIKVSAPSSSSVPNVQHDGITSNNQFKWENNYGISSKSSWNTLTEKNLLNSYINSESNMLSMDDRPSSSCDNNCGTNSEISGSGGSRSGSYDSRSGSGSNEGSRSGGSRSSSSSSSNNADNGGNPGPHRGKFGNVNFNQLDMEQNLNHNVKQEGSAVKQEDTAVETIKQKGTLITSDEIDMYSPKNKLELPRIHRSSDRIDDGLGDSFDSDMTHINTNIPTRNSNAAAAMDGLGSSSSLSSSVGSAGILGLVLSSNKEQPRIFKNFMRYKDGI